LLKLRRFGNDRTEVLRLFTFDHFPVLAVTYHIRQPVLPALEEVMDNFAELMHRLLEIQSGGRQRSPKLIAEDTRLVDGLRKRSLAGKPTLPVKLCQDSQEQTQFKA
jgi:hypothetical protein